MSNLLSFQRALMRLLWYPTARWQSAGHRGRWAWCEFLIIVFLSHFTEGGIAGERHKREEKLTVSTRCFLLRIIYKKQIRKETIQHKDPLRHFKSVTFHTAKRVLKGNKMDRENGQIAQRQPHFVNKDTSLYSERKVASKFDIYRRHL